MATAISPRHHRPKRAVNRNSDDAPTFLQVSLKVEPRVYHGRQAKLLSRNKHSWERGIWNQSSRKEMPPFLQMPPTQAPAPRNIDEDVDYSNIPDDIPPDPFKTQDRTRYLTRKPAEIIAKPNFSNRSRYLPSKHHRERVARDAVRQRGQRFLKRKPQLPVDPNRRGKSVLAAFRPPWEVKASASPEGKDTKHGNRTPRSSRYRNRDAKVQTPLPVYDPWGKGGAGAPLRDGQGRIVTQLHTVQHQQQAAAHDAYDPWGHAGAGAALRDSKGRVQANLYQVLQPRDLAAAKQEGPDGLSYQPWGKQGHGAAVRDEEGRVEAQLHKIIQHRNATAPPPNAHLDKQWGNQNWGKGGNGAPVRTADGRVEAQLHKVLQQRAVDAAKHASEHAHPDAQYAVNFGKPGNGAPVRDAQGRIEPQLHKVLQPRQDLGGLKAQRALQQLASMGLSPGEPRSVSFNRTAPVRGGEPQALDRALARASRGEALPQQQGSSAVGPGVEARGNATHLSPRPDKAGGAGSGTHVTTHLSPRPSPSAERANKANLSPRPSPFRRPVS